MSSFNKSYHPNTVLEYIFFFYLEAYKPAMHKNVASGRQLNMLNNLTLPPLQQAQGVSRWRGMKWKEPYVDMYVCTILWFLKYFHVGLL